MSFSKSKDRATHWKPGGLLVMAGGKGCADISSLSSLPREEEVLVARGARLRVKSWNEATKTLIVELAGLPGVSKGGKDAAPGPLAELDEAMAKIPHREREDLGGPAIPLVDRWAADEDFGLGVVLPEIGE